MKKYIETDALLRKLFPLGIPRTRYNWEYSIPARAVYRAIEALSNEGESKSEKERMVSGDPKAAQAGAVCRPDDGQTGDSGFRPDCPE